MEKVKAWALAHRRIIGGVVLVVLLVVIAVLLFRSCKTEQPQKVTVEPQTQAQTEAGVEKAADAAQVPVSRQQAQDAAQEIRYIYQHDDPPEYTIITTGGDVEKQAQKGAAHGRGVAGHRRRARYRRSRLQRLA